MGQQCLLDRRDHSVGHAFLAHLLHRFGNEAADGRLAVGSNGTNMGNFCIRRDAARTLTKILSLIHI